MTTVTVEHDRARHDAIVQRRLAIAMERDAGALPIVVVQQPQQPPPQPPADKPGFGAGAITALVLVGIFALGWQLISRMDPGGLAFLAGTLATLGVVFAGMIFALWIGDHTR